MIGRLKGNVAEASDNWLLLDVNGVGYEIFCAPAVVAECLMTGGAPVTLYIDTHVRENEIKLYGFLSLAEKHWFVLLQSVQGVGAKVALAMLGTLPADTLAHAITAGDTKTLATTPGVGPKVAQRITNELKDKAAELAGITPTQCGTTAQQLKKGKNSKNAASPAVGSTRSDAVSALVNLGYPAAQASSAIQAAIEMHGPDTPTEELIRLGLKQLSG